MSKQKKNILIQLDPDPHASTFDAVVAIDSDVNHLIQYHSVESTQVRELVHGAMFTRGPQDLKHTAIFIGGSDVTAGQTLLEQVASCFFGPMRVSVMLDANGANTTAAAAVLTASNHQQIRGATAAVLAGTGSVGQRAVRLLAREGAEVRVGSRSAQRAQATCEAVANHVPDARLTPCATISPVETAQIIDGAQIVVAAGTVGVQLLAIDQWQNSKDLQVAIDLNAVPPVGIAGVEPTDRGTPHGNAACYGAIGVGAMKMKIHKAAVRQLFQSNDQVLDAEEIYGLGKQLLADS